MDKELKKKIFNWGITIGLFLLLIVFSVKGEDIVNGIVDFVETMTISEDDIVQDNYVKWESPLIVCDYKDYYNPKSTVYRQNLTSNLEMGAGNVKNLGVEVLQENLINYTEEICTEKSVWDSKNNSYNTIIECENVIATKIGKTWIRGMDSFEPKTLYHLRQCFERENVLDNFEIDVSIPFMNFDMKEYTAISSSGYNQTTSYIYFWRESPETIWMNVTLNSGENLSLILTNSTGIASDGEKTFYFFDDFNGTSLNASKWNTSQTSGTMGGGIWNGSLITNFTANKSLVWKSRSALITTVNGLYINGFLNSIPSISVYMFSRTFNAVVTPINSFGYTTYKAPTETDLGYGVLWNTNWHNFTSRTADTNYYSSMDNKPENTTLGKDYAEATRWGVYSATNVRTDTVYAYQYSASRLSSGSITSGNNTVLWINNTAGSKLTNYQINVSSTLTGNLDFSIYGAYNSSTVFDKVWFNFTGTGCDANDINISRDSVNFVALSWDIYHLFSSLDYGFYLRVNTNDCSAIWMNTTNFAQESCNCPSNVNWGITANCTISTDCDIRPYNFSCSTGNILNITNGALIRFNSTLNEGFNCSLFIKNTGLQSG